MSNHRRRLATRRSTERIIAQAIERGVVERDAGDDVLVRLLAGAVPTALDHETDGEAHALVALRSTRAAPPGPAVKRRAKGARAGFRRFSTAYVVGAATAAIVAAGSIAVAGAIGVGMPDFPGDRGVHAAAPPAAGGDPTRAPTHPRPSASSSPSAPSPTSPNRPGTQPSAPASTSPQTLAALCRAYQELPRDQQARALRYPAYAALVRAAGNRGQVSAYCAGLSGSAEPAGPSDPTRPSSPATHGKGQGKSHSEGQGKGQGKGKGQGRDSGRSTPAGRHTSAAHPAYPGKGHRPRT